MIDIGQQGIQGFPMGAAISGKVILSPTRLFEVPSSAMIRLGQDQAVFVYVPQSKSIQARTVKVERYAGKSMFVSCVSACKIDHISGVIGVQF